MRRRLLLHAAVLAVVLLAGLAYVGTDGVLSADEGAMLAELDLLERTGDWTLPNPEPVVDPGMARLPLELSERSAEGRWAPFAKHPVHIELLRPAWAAGGEVGVLLVSVASVVVAAACAGLLAERLRPGAGPWALWLTGVGSPLLFDAYQVVGHALGAALLGVAAVAAVGVADAGPGPRRPAATVLGVLAVGAATVALAFVRSEGVLAGLALGAAFGVAGLLRRHAATVLAGAVAALGAGAVRLLEPSLLDRALGAASIGTGPLASGEVTTGVAGRWTGFRTTVLDAGYGLDAGEPLLLLALVLAVAAAVAWRRLRDERLVRILAVAAAAAAVGRFFTADFLVPGLLPALPLLAVAMVLVGGRHVRVAPRPELWATVALFAAAVVATQYSSGGNGEWGGRYFAVGLPVAVALATVVVLDVAGALPAGVRRVVGVAAAVVVVSIAAGALRVAGDARRGAADVATEVVGRIDELDVDATVSARGAVSRFAWEAVLDGRRWLTTTPEDAAVTVASLEVDGVDRVALVLRDEEDVEEAVPAGWEVEDVAERRGGVVVLLVR